MIDDEWQPPLEIPDAKVVHYLLNVDHPKGGPKARFFLAFGFERPGPGLGGQELRAATRGLHPSHRAVAMSDVAADQIEVLQAVVAEALLAQVDALGPERQVADVTGQKRMICEGPMPSPDGRSPHVRTVWQLQAGIVWRLITAVPLT